MTGLLDRSTAVLAAARERNVWRAETMSSPSPVPRAIPRSADVRHAVQGATGPTGPAGPSVDRALISGFGVGKLTAGVNDAPLQRTIAVNVQIVPITMDQRRRSSGSR